ncbi:MAG: hypothetical protein U5L02_03880 [Rheinheimera sp.]|nr:hypothetical protein [Rheinheimera sp.]
MQLVQLWRGLMAAADYRRHWRTLTGQPKLDVVFICNVRDEAERVLFYKPGATSRCQENGPRLYINGVAGQIRGINFTAAEMYSREGRKVAKLAFIDAVRWAEAQGAKVILLAASTKRLFGRDGLELKQLFPQLIFTIGDNGTAQLLCADVDRAIASSGLARPRILVIGPYGILGSAVCQHLQQQGAHLLGFGGNETYLREFAENTGIAVVHDLRDTGPVDLVVACTHSDNARLSAEHIALLRKANQKLVVVDVAEPANLDRQVYRTVQNDVIRQDAGNAWSADLTYVLGSLTAKQLMLAQGTVFGCFAEALALYHTVYREYNPTPLSRDWFDVNAFNQTLIAEAFHSLRIGLPQPHCFGKPVGEWSLWQTGQPAVGEQS